MDRDELEEKWDDLKYKLWKKWDRLTEDDLKEIDGDMDKLIHKVVVRQGIPREQVTREIHNWIPKI